MSRRNRRFAPSILTACFCVSGAKGTEEGEWSINIGEKLTNAIQIGDLDEVERLLIRVVYSQNFTLTVRRRHLKASHCFVERSSDPFIYFNQECNPVLWAVDCQQWKVLPLLYKRGYDSNRPQLCRRWTSVCSPSSKPTISPYKKFWTRGKYTYQSSLDYFFASVYEILGDDVGTLTATAGNDPLTLCFQQLPLLLTSGVDVHRLDSVIVFNQLAASFDRHLTHYTNEKNHVPDIPENTDSHVELGIVRTLIQNGFSQFECMEFLSPCHNWFGILLCLLCHPKIDTFGGDVPLPPIIRQAALIMINLLAMRCSFPTPNEFEDNLENLQLRKLYTKRYAEHRVEFNARLQLLRKQCLLQKTEPLSLRMITRNQLRKQIGGVGFRSRVSALPLPQSLSNFIQFIEVDHLKSCAFPASLVELARGDNIFYTAYSLRDGEDTDSTS